MYTAVAGAGSLLLRGLGPSGLLLSRGLGGHFELIISTGRPRQTRYGGSGRREEREKEEIRSIFVRARLVEINGKSVMNNSQNTLGSVEGTAKVTYGIDSFKVTSAIPRVSKRLSSIGLSSKNNINKGVDESIKISVRLKK